MEKEKKKRKLSKARSIEYLVPGQLKETERAAVISSIASYAR